LFTPVVRPLQNFEFHDPWGRGSDSKAESNLDQCVISYVKTKLSMYFIAFENDLKVNSYLEGTSRPLQYCTLYDPNGNGVL
jgi:hypothetical protein